MAESLRLNIPNPAILRMALRDGVTPGGREYKQGDEFVLYTAIANRDPAYFGDDPASFNPFRAMKEGVPRWGFRSATVATSASGARSRSGASPTWQNRNSKVQRSVFSGR